MFGSPKRIEGLT